MCYHVISTRYITWYHLRPRSNDRITAVLILHDIAWLPSILLLLCNKSTLISWWYRKWDSFHGCIVEYTTKAFNGGEWRAGSACCIMVHMSLFSYLQVITGRTPITKGPSVCIVCSSLSSGHHQHLLHVQQLLPWFSFSFSPLHVFPVYLLPVRETNRRHSWKVVPEVCLTIVSFYL